MLVHRGVLDKIQERAYYVVSDSLFFKYDSNEWNPETGDFLGQLTFELKSGLHIDEFVSGGQ